MKTKPFLLAAKSDQLTCKVHKTVNTLRTSYLDANLPVAPRHFLTKTTSHIKKTIITPILIHT